MNKKPRKKAVKAKVSVPTITKQLQFVSDFNKRVNQRIYEAHVAEPSDLLMEVPLVRSKEKDPDHRPAFRSTPNKVNEDLPFVQYLLGTLPKPKEDIDFVVLPMAPEPDVFDRAASFTRNFVKKVTVFFVTTKEKVYARCRRSR